MFCIQLIVSNLYGNAFMDDGKTVWGIKCHYFQWTAAWVKVKLPQCTPWRHTRVWKH